MSAIESCLVILIILIVNMDGFTVANGDGKTQNRAELEGRQRKERAGSRGKGGGVPHPANKPKIHYNI